MTRDGAKSPAAAARADGERRRGDLRERDAAEEERRRQPRRRARGRRRGPSARRRSRRRARRTRARPGRARGRGGARRPFRGGRRASPPAAGRAQRGRGSRAEARRTPRSAFTKVAPASDTTTASSRVEREVDGPEGEPRRDREERGLAEHGDHDRVRHDAREDRGDEGLRLEVVAVEDLGREQRGAERRAEHRRDAGGDPGDEQHAALDAARRRGTRPTRAPRARADLHGGPLAAAGAAGGERSDGGHRLHGDDAPADHAAAVVGLDGRVAAAPRGLRREAGGEEPAREAAERGQEREQPRAERRPSGERGPPTRRGRAAARAPPRARAGAAARPRALRRTRRRRAPRRCRRWRRAGARARRCAARAAPRGGRSRARAGARRGVAPRAEPGAQPASPRVPRRRHRPDHAVTAGARKAPSARRRVAPATGRLRSNDRRGIDDRCGRFFAGAFPSSSSRPSDGARASSSTARPGRGSSATSARGRGSRSAGARDALSSHLRSGDRRKLGVVLADLARDERILAAAACGEDLRTLARTGALPTGFACEELRARGSARRAGSRSSSRRTAGSCTCSSSASRDEDGGWATR